MASTRCFTPACCQAQSLFAMSTRRFGLVAALAALALGTGTISGAAEDVSGRGVVVFSDTSRIGQPFAKDPSVIKFGGRYLMYYSLPGAATEAVKRWSVGIAQSRDLRTWEKIGELPPGEGEESKGIAAPGALVRAGRVHLFYQTYGNGKTDAICHAVSSDGVTFTRDASNPIFRPIGKWNAGRAIDAEVVVWQGRALLYYATRDPEMKRQMLGVAAAPADSDFSRSHWRDLSVDGPILQPELPWELTCIEAASICVRAGRLVMFYAGGYNNAPQQIGVATSFDGVQWTRLSNEPLLRNGPPGSWNSSESGHPGVFVEENGDTHLFFQGNDTRGKTWSIGRHSIRWDGFTPALVKP
jgi:predicted GH43/DUF377 family glycosyl hydrolase